MFKSKIINIVSVGFSLFFIGSNSSAMAMGIIVSDPQNTAYSVQNIAKWAQQINEMQNQYAQMLREFNQLVEIKNTTTGARGMGNIFHNAGIDLDLSTNWKTTLDDVYSSSSYKVLRAQYPSSDTADINAYFDTQAQAAAMTQSIYAKSTDRVKQVGKLMTEIDLASDQAAKLDLNNRLIAEQANIAANKHLAEIIKVKNQEDRKKAGIKATQAFICNEFKEDC